MKSIKRERKKKKKKTNKQQQTNKLCINLLINYIIQIFSMFQQW